MLTFQKTTQKMDGSSIAKFIELLQEESQVSQMESLKERVIKFKVLGCIFFLRHALEGMKLVETGQSL